jgi:two-component system, chemotaxis family, response regulator WspF
MNQHTSATHIPANIFPTLVVIGASTGGPKALAAIISQFPVDFGAAVVLIQHVGADFAWRMADWLNTQSVLDLHMAKPGERPKPGTILFPSGDGHLILGPNLGVLYTNQPEGLSYRPSVDAFFMSAAKHWPGPIIGALLTGMGRDGAEGLLALRKVGAHTIAQDESTSIIYSMPKVAKELGAARQVLPLPQIAQAISVRVPRKGVQHQ